jgi:DNA adenine methylase
VLPFLKWAGGKRWLFDQEFINGLPAFEQYIEPFLGGGAGFFALNPKKAILSDINANLIELYEVVRDHPSDLEKSLAAHQAATYYYEVRSANPSTPILRAARMLYLNRTCWNGLYRLNKEGVFNVPIGTKTAVLLDTDDFTAASDALKNCELLACDFGVTIDKAVSGDLVFVDPPYTVKHNLNGFVKYNENIFRWQDQIRLRDAIFDASERGAAIILTNANHHSIKDLYKDFGEHVEISRCSVISGKSSGRADVTELVVRL